jgi:hypothetical protein
VPRAQPLLSGEPRSPSRPSRGRAANACVVFSFLFFSFLVFSSLLRLLLAI